MFNVGFCRTRDSATRGTYSSQHAMSAALIHRETARKRVVHLRGVWTRTYYRHSLEAEGDRARDFLSFADFYFVLHFLQRLVPSRKQ